METVNLHRWYWFPVTGPDYPGIGHYVIVDADGTTVCNPSPMGQANARLIAAAPDLLAALQRLVHPMADDTDLENARDVIARATGNEETMYMNPNTGSVDTLDGWESTDGLVQVRRDENGDWVAA